CGPAQRVAVPGWHLSYRAENVFRTSTATTTSCRFLTRLSGSGTRVRVEFNSVPNSRGFTVLRASIALPVAAGRLDVLPATSRLLTFAHWPQTRVDGGRSVLSDPLGVVVRPGTAVLVTVTASAGDASSKGVHTDPSGCRSGEPASVGTAPGSVFSTASNVRWVRSILTDGVAQRSVVALGDSITEGPSDAAPWTQQLLAAGMLVGNAGVYGGAISRAGFLDTPAGIVRARALLDEPNVTDLVVLLGTNDIAFGSSDAGVLAALDQVITAARDRGVKISVCTILPRSDVGWTAASEAKRISVNNHLKGNWLSSRGATLIDTAAAMQDPSVPTRLLAAYNSGDGLHPNVVGARQLGLAVLDGLLHPAVPAPVSSVTTKAPAPSVTSSPSLVSG
ncbi:MAG: hypothetical protein QOC80_1913, partial [Frankiaceae bacterium]|nr:hypothetical protein [Frankiaceae bacterium]